MSPMDASLLDVLIDGFEKNEILRGFHWRELPLGTDAEAEAKFRALVVEATRWKGDPKSAMSQDGRQRASWDGLELRRAGRGVLVLVRAPRFSEWWHRSESWAADPMGPVHRWLQEQDP